MADHEKGHQADEWAQSALDRLRKDHLEPTPENFAVFYAYFSGSDGNLKMAIDTLLLKESFLTQHQCSELYQCYLGLEAERNVLQQSNSAIEDELKNVLGALEKTVAGTSQYNEKLSTFTGELQKAPDIETIRSALTRVALETRVMVEQNQRLHNQLAKSTEQLTEVRFNLDQVRKDSLIDPLTEVGNRKFFNNELARATADAVETDSPLSLLMIDIDHFKKFNDTYGHLIGDQVLRLVARTLVENLKGRDIIARYGGEEFVILLPQTRAADAERVANLLRNILSTKQIQRKRTGETLGIVTISIGATEYYPVEDLENFIARADEALYVAKETGRNKAVCKTLTPEEAKHLPQQKTVEFMPNDDS